MPTKQFVALVELSSFALANLYYELISPQFDVLKLEARKVYQENLKEHVGVFVGEVEGEARDRRRDASAVSTEGARGGLEECVGGIAD